MKDSADVNALKSFVKRYPESTLAVNAQGKIDVLEQNAREREAAQRAAREEAERQRKEAEAQKKREDEERRAAAAEAAQKAKAAEAERRAEEAKRKAEEGARNKAAAEAEKLRLESERKAREAETERRKAEAQAAQEAICKTEGTRLDAIVAKGSDRANVEELKRFANETTCERLKPQVTAKLELVDRQYAGADQVGADAACAHQLLRGCCDRRDERRDARRASCATSASRSVRRAT